MMTRANRSAWWIRVSGDTQSEQDQIPDIQEYNDDKGYQHIRTFEVHGKSAYHGAQDPDWQKVVRAFQNDEIDVVIIWMVDRLDRKNILHAVPMVSAVVDVGGRIEFSEQPECNLDANDPNHDDALEAFTRRINDAHRESKIKSKRILKKHRRLRDAGSVIGRAPWGYEIHTTSDGIKILVPTTVGRKYIPLIFSRVIKGDSLRTIAQWLDSEGVKSPQGGDRWNEGYIGTRLIKNPTYYGSRPNAGNLETEALVSVQTWQQANESLKSRHRHGRSTVKREKAFLAPVCGACYNEVRDGCPSGISPMYRVHSAYGSAGDGDYYRCAGHGPQRKGCGAKMYPCDLAEQIVREAIAHSADQHREREFIPGDDYSEKIAKLRELGASAMRKGDYQAATEAMQQAGELESMPTVRPHYDYRDTGMSEAEYFESLGRPAQRVYLAERYEIRISAAGGVHLTERQDWTS